MANDASAPAAPKRRRGSAAAERLATWLRDYRPLPGARDELLDQNGLPRDLWLGLLREFAGVVDGEFAARFNMAARHFRDSGASRNRDVASDRWPLDPLPLVVGQAEWDQIAAGVTQRVELLEALLKDIYGDGRLVAEGILPAAAITGSPDFIRAVRGAPPAGGRFIQLYAADLGKGPDGRWRVLQDRTQAPTGAGYALENRLIVSRAFPQLYNTLNAHRLAPFFDGFRRGLAEAADRSDPRICLLTAGRTSLTYFEQAYLARYLGFLLVEGGDLVARDGRVYVRTIAGLKRADVIHRRVDADSLDPLELNAASTVGTPGMLEAIRLGGVAVLNMPGSGLAESPALLGFLPALSQRLLGEDLRLPHVATWWCGQPAERQRVERALEDLVVAPAFHLPGGAGPRLFARLSEEEKGAIRRQLADRPGDLVGQEAAQVSTMPVLRDGRLVAAPFTLRVYVCATPEGLKVMPGGYCRTALGADTRAITMGQGTRTADVWVIDDKPVDRMSLITGRDEVRVRRIPGHLPSRAADNLFWLGRYIERAEAALRLVRSLCTSLMDDDAGADAHGEAFEFLRDLLVQWGALDATAGAHRSLDAARDALHGPSYGSVISMVRSAKRTASGMRERLSGDFWALLLELEADLSGGAQAVASEAQALKQVEDALQHIAGLSGLAQENMNRVAGWRFLDIGKRIERGVNTCQLARTLAHDQATIEDLDLLLELNDAQITYRSRYMVGLALAPVRDLVVLDPFNTRSLAFQLDALREHLASLPSLLEDGIPERPARILLPLAAEVEAQDARELGAERIEAFENALTELSNAVADRYFLQGANAVPTVKLAGLA